MKKVLRVIAIIFMAVIILASIGIGFLIKDLEAVKSNQIEGVSLSKLSDGEYIGSYSLGRFSNTVKVVITNHRIVSIEVLKPVTLEREEVTEALFQSVIGSQSLDVDTISQATATSLAYLKSIEGALKP